MAPGTDDVGGVPGVAAGGDETLRTRAAAVRAVVVPDWLAEVVRPKPARPPWPQMLRAALAICVPLAVSLALNSKLGVLVAMGGLLGTLTDTGGPYLTRLKRVSSAAVFGGAVGLAIGSVIHGHGWVAVAALVVVAGASGLLSTTGDIGSVTGLQLLVYAALGLGPVGALRPEWHAAVGFLAGVAWAVILIVPGWLAWPRAREQRDVAAVYAALAAELRAVGSDAFTGQRRALTAALNTAYDELLTARSTASGRNRRMMRLVAALNASHAITEAATAAGVAGTPPPPLVADTVDRLGAAIGSGGPPPMIPPAWDTSPAMRALRDAMAGAARVLSRDWSPEPPPGRAAAPRLPSRAPSRAGRFRAAAGRAVQALGGGRTGRIFTLRLMVCIGAAGVVSEVLPLQRSYWVLLTVAITLKPDYGSVFARAVQRGLGTVVGAVAGAVLLILIHGSWLLIPFAILAALLPYGRSRNYGLLATFLTPLVVVLIDLLAPAGWRLATDRLIDTLIGCAITLLLGFAPWPAAWYAHLPRQFGLATMDVRAYLTAALGDGGGADGMPAAASRLRRSAYRALADLRAEFQRTMSEPRPVSRRASAWWPATVALEQVMDAITATAVAVRGGPDGGGPDGEGPDRGVPAAGVRQLAAALAAVGQAAAGATAMAGRPELPADEVLAPVTESVRALLGVVGHGQRLAA